MIKALAVRVIFKLGYYRLIKGTDYLKNVHTMLNLRIKKNSRGEKSITKPAMCKIFYLSGQHPNTLAVLLQRDNPWEKGTKHGNAPSVH